MVNVLQIVRLTIALIAVVLMFAALVLKDISCKLMVLVLLVAVGLFLISKVKLVFLVRAIAKIV